MGEIVTFYSYKGGSGRSMAVANIAWILASNGLKVMVIDWDLEAPGLHRYFRPFLGDPDLVSSPGLIDFFIEYALKAVTPPRKGADTRGDWVAAYTDLLPYTYSLEWSFPGEGVIDFVPAGKQDAGYPRNVNSFNWENLYQVLGGYAFIDRVRHRIRDSYDYVLIDSRTGVSDTSGICTIQMPDVLVMCFILNNQSIEGASMVARAVTEKRRDGSGSHALRILPVAMRTRQTEEERLRNRERYARAYFQPFVAGIKDYWAAAEVPDVDYYAYEEVLAAFKDEPGNPRTVLAALERVTGLIAGDRFSRLVPPNEYDRSRVLDAFSNRTPLKSLQAPERKDFLLSYNHADRAWAEWIAWQLEQAGYSVVIPTRDFAPGSNFDIEMQRAANEAQHTIAVLSPDYLAAAFTQPEWASAFAKDPTGQDRKLVPVRVRECRPKGLLATLVYIDLVGQKEAVARKALLDGVGRGTRAPSATMGPQADRPRFPGGLPAIWNVPDLRNPNFTGREQLLQELRASLSSGLAAAIVPIAGLGGAGKTQLALEYAYRHTADYDIVWWVRAEDTATLTADYAALANHLGLPEKDLADQQAAAVAVRSWLGHNPGWLLILDNAHSAADCRDYLPMGAAGHVLITSRDPNWGAIAKPLRLPVLARMEGVEFLQKRCGRDEPAAAGELCEALGDLPLALEHAGAYIEATGGSIAKYLGLYRSRPREVLTDAVGATWEIALKRLQTQAPLALNLLYLVAFLAPDDIDPKLVAPAFPDATRFGEARAALLQYSLIDVSGGGIAAHRLVQATTRDQLAKEAQEQKWAEAALELVSSAFPFKLDVAATWSASARLLPHALAATGHSERLGVALASTDRLLNQAGLYLRNRGQLREAGEVLIRALAIAERIYGPDHPTVAIRAANIGQTLRDTGDLAGALQYTQRALAMGEKGYGPDHPNMAILANNIGTILSDRGDLAGALRYTQRALEIDEKVHGRDHPTVARDANNVAAILQAQGDLAGALKFAQRALAIDEKAYGPDHPSVAAVANNIGSILQAQGDLVGALRYTQRALAIDEKVYGPDHPNAAIRAGNIGAILGAQGDLVGALQYTQRALRMLQATYGPDSPHTKRASQNLVSIERDLAKRDGGTPPAMD